MASQQLFIDNLLLKFIDLFRGVITRLGVDYEQLRAIVEVKLMMDNRRQVISYSKNQKPPSNAFVKTLIFYAIFGSFVALGVYFIPSFILSMIVFFSYIMVIIIMTLITDFSSILLDTSDNTIILPRPVGGRTLFVARIMHILLYLGQLTIGLSIATIIVVAIKYGMGLLLLFLVLLVLSIITAVSLTNAFYLLLLNFISEEKLKNVINYFQIVMAVFVMGGYQILPRMIGRIDMENFVFEIKWWAYLLPPVWMAGTMETFYLWQPDAEHLLLAMCAVVLPIAGMIGVNTYLTPVFSRKLGAIDNSATQPSKPKTENRKLTDRIGGWMSSSPIERGTFDMIFKVLSRDRKIKLKIYPSFGYILVFGFIFMMRSKEDLATTWANLSTTQYHLLIIYLTFMVTQVALHEIPYSDDFKASWVYFSIPLEKPGEILSGTLKAIFVQLFLPAYVVLSIFILFVWKAATVDDLFFGLLNNIIMLYMLAMISERRLPFSSEPNMRAQAGNFARSILVFMAVGVLGVLHYLLAMKPLLVVVAMPVQLVVIYFLHRAYKRTEWSSLTL